MAKPAHGSTATTEWDRDAALTAAHILLEIKAVNFRPEEPYTFTSGSKSPVYIDCRRIIYFPQARSKICDLAVQKVQRHVGYDKQALAWASTRDAYGTAPTKSRATPRHCCPRNC